MRIFDVRGVSYSYQDQAALHDITIQICKGERIGLLGANGSGKSTLLRLLAGLDFPGTGHIEFLGEPLSAASMKRDDFFYGFRKRVGVVFQNPDVQLFNASVLDEVAFGPLQLGWSKTDIRQRVEESLVALGIADLRHRAPHRLSGGEKKRVALASVLVMDPEVLLLDEPTAALDPRSHAQILELLASWRGGGRTIITATHDLDSLEDLSDRCYLLQSGRVAGAGEPLELLHNVRLLERSGLIRIHSHVHPDHSTGPHPHVHRQDLPE